MISVIGKSKEEKELLTVIEDALKPEGFRVIDIDYEKNAILRIFIDYLITTQPPSVTIDDCSKANTIIQKCLKNINWLTSTYNLEVSSPGFDRRLRLKNDFEKAIGCKIKLRLNGPKKVNLEGVLTSFSGDTLIIMVGNNERKILLSEIRRANKVYENYF